MCVPPILPYNTETEAKCGIEPTKSLPHQITPP